MECIDNCDSTSDFEHLILALEKDQFLDIKEQFLLRMKHNLNFAFWWTYIESVSLLLTFYQSSGGGGGVDGGIWDLHLLTFHSMIPFFMTYIMIHV